jgi:hypothetical protein
MASESPRPLLLPQNRRLRHLQGISLRNLTLTHPRGYTIDDAALNKSPEKLEALREPELHHSQSTDTLNAKKRPGKTRRRSTIWVGQSPGYRQKKLEDVIYGGMADSFFSLHCEGQSDPRYVSEVVKKAMVSPCNTQSVGASLESLLEVTLKQVDGDNGKLRLLEPFFPIFRPYQLWPLRKASLCDLH